MKILKWLFGCKIQAPENLKFKQGQKVATSITHEVLNSVVGVGTILKWSHKSISYWAFSDQQSDWYKVKMENGKVITYPEERLEDLVVSINRWTDLYKRYENRIGEKGFSLESALRITQLINYQNNYNQNN